MADDDSAFPTLDATQISFLGTLGERSAATFEYATGTIRACVLEVAPDIVNQTTDRDRLVA